MAKGENKHSRTLAYCIILCLRGSHTKVGLMSEHLISGWLSLRTEGPILHGHLRPADSKEYQSSLWGQSFPSWFPHVPMCKVAAGPSFGWLLRLPNSYQCQPETIQACLYCPLTFSIIFSRPKRGVIRVLMWIGMPKSWTKPAKEWVWNTFCFLTYFWSWLNLISCPTFPWS